MKYASSVEFPGDAKVGLARLADTFTPLGFRIEHRGSHVLELSGPGMSSTRQSPLMGISSLHAEASGRLLKVTVEFQALDRLLRFIAWLILGLCVFMVALFTVLFRNRPDFHLWMVVLPFAPWPVLLPALARTLQRRIQRTLDNLLHNYAVLAERPF
jgi:hypothetical protein